MKAIYRKKSYLLLMFVFTLVLCGCEEKEMRRFDTITIGNYNGAQLNWLVINETATTATLLCDTFVDKRSYNDTDDFCTWESCELRTWLNNDFYDMAFTSEEKDKIIPQTYSNLDNQIYLTNGGADTIDFVTLPSLYDMEEIYYGSIRNTQKNSKKRSKHEEFCMADVCAQLNDYDDRDWWWLRSPGNLSNTAAVVGASTTVSYSGMMVDDSLTGGYIRPMIEIKKEGSGDVSEEPDYYEVTEVTESIIDDNNTEATSTKVYTTANFEDFWINENTFDVFGYLEANGATDFNAISIAEKTMNVVCYFDKSKFEINFYDTGYGCQIHYTTYLDSVGEGKHVSVSVFGEQGKYDMYNVYGHANTYMTHDAINVLQLLVEASRDNNISTCPLCGATNTHKATKEYHSIQHAFWGLD